MKLQTIIIAFNAATEVYDSIKTFKRKWELAPAYRELKEAVELFNEEKRKLILKYGGDSEIAKNKAEEYNKEFWDLWNQEVDFKKPLMFTLQEAEDSKIAGSKLVSILDFIKE